MVLANGVELSTTSIHVHCPDESDYRDKRTAVPMIKGDFIAAQSAKCARFSASVRLPLPTSSMSGSG